ncbi:MAG: nucleoside hydrolase, partial [Candidatus Eremiobacterota bacterium]
MSWVVDTDIGNDPDDVVAILLLIARGVPSLILTNLDTERRSRLSFLDRLLEAAGCRVPTAAGPPGPASRPPLV